MDMQDFSNLLENDAIDEDDFLTQLSAILMLPREHFDQVSALFLSSLREQMADADVQLGIIAGLRQNNLSLDDIYTSIQNLQETDDESLEDYQKDFLVQALTIILNSGEDFKDTTARVVSIPIEIMEHGTQPRYAHATDAGMDIYAPEEIEIAPGEQTIIKAGFKVAIPQGYALLVQPRSGLSAKTKLRICNTPGLIDSGYRDEVGVIIENIEPKIKDIDIEQTMDKDGKVIVTTKSVEFGSSYTIHKGDRIAQLRLVEAPQINFVPVDTILDFESDRDGGFGSTGK